MSVTTGDGQDIWIRSLTGESGARLTFAGGVHLRATWMPGSESVFFISDRTGEGALFRKPDDGGADAVPVPIVEERPVFDVAFSPDGEWIIFRTDNLAPGRGDLYALPTNGDSVPVELLATPAEEAVPALSPNGRWLAYQSDESGRREIYVRPFPNTQGSRWQVSTEGGREPLWANSGRELFYRDDNDDLIAVQVTQEPSFTSGPQRRLFSASPYLRSGFHQSYDITLDDQRFLMIREEAAEDDAGLVLVLNWFEVLNASVGN